MLPLEYHIVTKTYLKPNYLPTYATVVTVVKFVEVVTVVTVVTVLTVGTKIGKRHKKKFHTKLFSPKKLIM